MVNLIFSMLNFGMIANMIFLSDKLSMNMKHGSTDQITIQIPRLRGEGGSYA